MEFCISGHCRRASRYCQQDMVLALLIRFRLHWVWYDVSVLRVLCSLADLELCNQRVD